MLIVLLFVLGLIAGSFINVLVWRLQHGQPIAIGRSKCPDCQAVLGPLELVPVVSWLALRGRCRHCAGPISIQYPLVESATAVLFVGSYIFWPASFAASGQGLLLATWLAASVGLIALAVYDLRYMLLPSRLIYPTLFVAATGQGIYTVFYSPRPLHHLVMWALSIIVASGIFWALFIISGGKWIGYGDVRLGLVTGTLLADPGLAWAMLFFASLLGTCAALPGILRGHKNLTHKLSFGPFLVAATVLSLLFGQSILDWYKRLIGA